MEDQIRFQKEKYEQLSESYRQSRRIIHDLKKQYFCINEYVDNKEYDKLKTFTSEAVRDIESTYSKYNTGNLVIDSFLTNYDTLAAKNHIQFVAKLGVTYNRIPVNDYDLCVILGNMLDNCLKACIANPSSENFIHIAIATTENDKFTIHCENTTAEEHPWSTYMPAGKIPSITDMVSQYTEYSRKISWFLHLQCWNPLLYGLDDSDYRKKQTHYALIQLIECLRIGRQEFLHEVLYFRVALW